MRCLAYIDGDIVRRKAARRWCYMFVSVNRHATLSSLSCLPLLKCARWVSQHNQTLSIEVDATEPLKPLQTTCDPSINFALSMHITSLRPNYTTGAKPGK